MSEHRSVFRRIFYNVSFLTIGRIVNALCSFVYISFAVRSLGLTKFGVLILIHSLAMLASTISRMQSWQSLIKFGSQPYANRDRDLFARVLYFCIRLDAFSAIVAILLGVVFVFFYSLTSGWTDHDRGLALCYMLITPFMYTGWANGVLRLTDRFRLVPINDSATALVRTAGTLAGYFCHFHLGYFLAVWAATVALDYTLFMTFAVSTLREKLQFSVRLRDVWRDWRWALPEMWAFTRSTSINQTLGAISNNAGTLIIGNLLGPAEAALFRVCRQISNGIVTPAQLISPVLYPELVRMRDKRDWAGLRKVTWRIFAILSAISLVLLLIAGTLGGKIFALILNMHIHYGAYYVTVMLVSAILTLLLVPLEPLLIVMGDVRSLMTNRTMIMIVYFPLLYFMTKYWSLGGACYATALSSAAMLMARLWRIWIFSRRHRQDTVNPAPDTTF